MGRCGACFDQPIEKGQPCYDDRDEPCAGSDCFDYLHDDSELAGIRADRLYERQRDEAVVGEFGA